MSLRVRGGAYFETIEAELCAHDNSGYRRMKHDLLNMNLSGWDHTEIPESVGLAEQRELSLAVHEQWWADCLTRGRIETNSMMVVGASSWPDWLSTDELFDSYCHFNRSRPRPDQHPYQLNTFGRWLHSVLKLKPYRPGRKAPNRRPGYRLGELDNQRRAFDERHSTRLFPDEARDA